MKSIYLDLDDTLIYTQYKFNQAAIDCMAAMSVHFTVDNPHPKLVMDHFINLELENAENFGFQKVRFANSWVETYRFFTERLDREYDTAMEQRIKEIANQVNEPPFVPVKNAAKAIERTRPLAKEMFILTMGDPAVQQAKIDSLPREITEAIDDVFIVSKKSADILKEIIGDRDPRDCVMVGNSARSDIAPAVKVGTYAVHIPTETWMYDAHGESFYYNRLYTIPGIKQLPTIIKAING
jgi:putative hydrolase of the HAD superfamily